MTTRDVMRQQALAEAIKAHAHREWTAEAIVQAAEIYFRFLSGIVTKEPISRD